MVKQFIYSLWNLWICVINFQFLQKDNETLMSKTYNPKHLLHLLPTEDRVLWSQHLCVKTEAGGEAAGGMSLTLLTVHGYSTSPVVCFWRVIFQPPGVYLQDTHPSWETHQCHTLAVGRHIAQCWVSETARVGLAVANKQRIEGSSALCATLLELRLIRYEAISEQAPVSCERSHQRLHWESHQIFCSGPLWTQTTSAPHPPPSFFPSLQLPSKHRHGMEI